MTLEGGNVVPQLPVTLFLDCLQSTECRFISIGEQY